jgi:hypothetical protein
LRVEGRAEMIRRNTWIVLVLLAALIGFSFYWGDRKARLSAEATPTPGSTTLISAADGSPTDIKIESSIGTAVEVARDEAGKWEVKRPSQAAADQGSAEAAATQAGALRILSDVHLGPDVIGLDKPTYTLTLGYGTSKTHKLLVGSETPIQDGYYAQLDGGQNVVVDKPGLDALVDLLSHPPYLATLTPVASSTPTAAPPTATPEATGTPVLSTPQASGTATP